MMNDNIIMALNELNESLGDILNNNEQVDVALYGLEQTIQEYGNNEPNLNAVKEIIKRTKDSLSSEGFTDVVTEVSELMDAVMQVIGDNEDED